MKTSTLIASGRTFLRSACLCSALTFALGTEGASILQFTSSSYSAGESAGSATLIVHRTDSLDTTVSVDFTTVNGTALAGSDYLAATGTLLFEPGVPERTITISILNDALVEGILGETFRVVLSSPTGGAVLGTRTTATVSITDTDVGIQFQFANYNVANGWSWAEDVGAVFLGVVRGDDANLPVTVVFGTSDVTATNGVDYVGVTNTLSFAPTERLKFVPVTILNDGLKERANKTLRATLFNPVGVSLGTTKTTTVTILDNDQGFQFETANYYVAEDAGVVVIGVLRGTDDTNSTVTVDLATFDNSATNGLDYVGTTHTVTFVPGERRRVVSIPILNDGLKEGLESFKLTLSNPTGGALGSRVTTAVYIRDNDPGVGFEAASYTTAWGQGADFAVTVLRGNDAAFGPITVDYATSDLTATQGLDYQAVSGTLTFQENETVKSLNIPILRGRSAKSFRVTLSNPTRGATLGATTTSVNIVGAYATVAPLFETALTIRREGGVNILSWAGGGQLQRADKPTGPWQTLTTATNPCTVQSAIATTFYRVTRPRAVNLYLPSSYDGQTLLPLVILLHGYGADGATQENYMRFQPWAEARGFLYCYPTGTRDRMGRPYWNGTDTRDFWSDHVDDAGYLRALIEEIGRRFAVDRKRVYIVGHSTGGFMAYALACQSADLIAGIATLAGNTFLDPSRCQPSQPVHILSLCGTLDENSFYYGGTWQTFANSLPYPGAVRTVRIWSGYNGCAQDPVTEPGPAIVTGLTTVVTRYTACEPGGAVELWSIIGGGHVPSLSSEFAPRVIDWLLAHPKP